MASDLLGTTLSARRHRLIEPTSVLAHGQHARRIWEPVRMLGSEDGSLCPGWERQLRSFFQGKTVPSGDHGWNLFRGKGRTRLSVGYILEEKKTKSKIWSIKMTAAMAWKESFLVLCRNKYMPTSAPIDPPRNILNHKVRSRTRRAPACADLALSNPKIKNAYKLIIIPYAVSRVTTLISIGAILIYWQVLNRATSVITTINFSKPHNFLADKFWIRNVMKNNCRSVWSSRNYQITIF